MEKYTSLMEFNPTLVMIIITLFVLYLILRKQFFEKIHNHIEARQSEVKNTYDTAAKKMQSADDLLRHYETKLAEADAEKREIIALGKQRADAQAKGIVDDAKEEAARIKAKAIEEIEYEKQKAVMEMKNQIAALAMLAAEKILEQQIDAEQHDEIVNKVIEQAGAGKWQN